MGYSSLPKFLWVDICDTRIYGDFNFSLQGHPERLPIDLFQRCFKSARRQFCPLDNRKKL